MTNAGSGVHCKSEQRQADWLIAMGFWSDSYRSRSLKPTSYNVTANCINQLIATDEAILTPAL